MKSKKEINLLVLFQQHNLIYVVYNDLNSTKYYPDVSLFNLYNLIMYI